MSGSLRVWQTGQFIGLTLVLGMATPLLAQSQRDPTLPPAAVGTSAPGDTNKPAVIQPGAVTVLVREGVPYLVVGTRLFAKGQKIGQARIERISETEVWLREDGALRKMPVFGGIERHVHTPLAAVMKPLKSVGATASTKP